jgi:hypothetical protein
MKVESAFALTLAAIISEANVLLRHRPLSIAESPA